MSDTCCSESEQTMLLACSGASNLGQLSNQAAVELTREGFGKMFCLAALGAHLPNFIHSAQNVPHLVAIDGCAVGCVKRVLEHAEIPVKSYFVVSDLGIEKTMDTVLNPSEVERVKIGIKKER